MGTFDRALLTTIAAGLLGAGPAMAAEPPSPGKAQEMKREPTKAERLDKLFAELKRESDPDKARKTADQIRAEWLDSGSATVNLLLQWSDKAVADKHYATALDLLDQITVLKPDFAEGWNRRATLHYIMDDYSKSMADIDRVLALEPRHFGALAGMAGIFLSIGNDQMAFDALRRVLDIYPANRDAQEQFGQLAEKLAGDSI
jgi:tetratricopeptide (TPR) repeat protein